MGFIQFGFHCKNHAGYLGLKAVLEILRRRRKRKIVRNTGPYGQRPKAPPPPPKPRKEILEEHLREKHEPLQEAWEQYQILLKIYKADEGVDNDEGTDDFRPW